MNQLEYDASEDPTLWEMSYDSDNPDCHHKLPGDWEFGGAAGVDPRSDPRWQPATYLFVGTDMRALWHTQEPMCDHQALGTMLKRVEEHRKAKVMVVTATYPGAEKAVTIYSDLSGMTSAANQG